VTKVRKTNYPLKLCKLGEHVLGLSQAFQWYIAYHINVGQSIKMISHFPNFRLVLCWRVTYYSNWVNFGKVIYTDRSY
jgi:hypothetical protein